jgi:hypothetical protein
VRQVCGGSDPASHRFLILSEIGVANCAFLFMPTGIEMTMREVCNALMEHGISEPDATRYLTKPSPASTTRSHRRALGRRCCDR